jgi:hypothetical protein
MKFIEWGQTSSDRGGSGQGIFLKLEPNKKYRLRLVSRPIQYFQHWDPIPCRSPGVDPETGKAIDPLLAQGFKPKERYSIWVINREDKQLKIIDFSPTLYEQFGNWKSLYNEEPGGKTGPDWVVEGKCPGGDKKRTKWTASYLDRVPFTEEELDAISKGKLSEKLAEARRNHTPDEILKMLAEKTGGASIPVPVQPPAAAVSAPVASQQRRPQAQSVVDGIDF